MRQMSVFEMSVLHRPWRDQKGLWITSFLRQLALSLVSIFIPIFIFSVGQKHLGGGGIIMGVLLVLFYRIVLRGTEGLLGIFIADKVIRKIGFRKSIIVSLIITAASFVSLSAASIYVNQSVGLILLAAFLFGLEMCFYWSAYNTMFIDDNSENVMGRSMGNLAIFSGLGGVVAPLIGAAIAIIFGFSALFISGLTLLLAAGIPMLFLGKHPHRDEVSWGEFRKWCQEKTFLKIGAAMGGEGVHDSILADLWPIYVFLIVGSIKSMGIFNSVLTMASVIFTYAVSNVFDKRGNRNYQIAGVIGGVMVWMFRTIVTGFGQVLMIDSVDRFFYAMSDIFLSGYAFKRAKGPETFSFIVYREVWLDIWVVGVYMLLAILLILVPLSLFWQLGFLMGAVGLSLGLLAKEHK
jgi:MFS family permease